MCRVFSLGALARMSASTEQSSVTTSVLAQFIRLPQYGIKMSPVTVIDGLLFNKSLLAAILRVNHSPALVAADLHCQGGFAVLLIAGKYIPR